MGELALSVRPRALVSLKLSADLQLQPSRVLLVDQVAHVEQGQRVGGGRRCGLAGAGASGRPRVGGVASHPVGVSGCPGGRLGGIGRGGQSGGGRDEGGGGVVLGGGGGGVVHVGHGGVVDDDEGRGGGGGGGEDGGGG